MRQRDRLLSCQLCEADALRFPPGGGNAFITAPDGFRSLNKANGWGEFVSQDYISQSEAFLPLKPGRSDVNP